MPIALQSSMPMQYHKSTPYVFNAVFLLIQFWWGNNTIMGKPNAFLLAACEKVLQRQHGKACD